MDFDPYGRQRSAPPPRQASAERGNPPHCPTHLYEVHTNQTEGQAGYQSVTDLCWSVSEPPLIDFPALSSTSTDCNTTVSSLPLFSSTPPQRLGHPSGDVPHRVRQAPEVVQRDEGSSADNPSSIELSGHHSSRDDARGITDERRDGHGCCRRALRAAFSLVVCISIGYLIIPLIPLAGILPIELKLMMPVHRSNWYHAHISHRAIYESDLDAYSSHVHRMAGTFSALYSENVVDPETHLYMVCRLVSGLRSATSLSSVSVGTLRGAKLALCGTPLNSTSSADDMVGGVSANGFMRALYLVSRPYYTFAEPLQKRISLPDDFANLTDSIPRLFRNKPSVALVVSQARRGNYAPAPARYCWSTEGVSQTLLYFTYPFVAYSTEAALRRGTPDNVAFIELELETSRMAETMEGMAVDSGVRVMVLGSTRGANGDPIVLANNWGQLVKPESLSCPWRWCALDYPPLRTSGIVDEGMREALRHIDLSEFEPCPECPEGRYVNTTVTFPYMGASASVSAWTYNTSEGLAVNIVLFSPEWPISGAYRHRLVAAIAASMLGGVAATMVVLVAFVYHWFTRPMRAISKALSAGISFGEGSDDSVARPASTMGWRRRAANPLRHRDGDERDTDPESGAEERDPFERQDELLRREVRRGGRYVRIVEVEELLRTYQQAMQQLRAADSFLPQTATLVSRSSYLASASLFTPTAQAEWGREGHQLTASPTGPAVHSMGNSPRGFGTAHPSMDAPFVPSSLMARGVVETPYVPGSVFSNAHPPAPSSSAGQSLSRSRMESIHMTATVAHIVPGGLEWSLSPVSSPHPSPGRRREGAHSGESAQFGSAVELEHYFAHVVKLADRFGGVVSSMTPELTTVVFNASILKFLVRLRQPGNPPMKDADRYAQEDEAISADATAAVRFSLALGRYLEGESRIIPTTRIGMDTTQLHLCRYYSPVLNQNYLFFIGRNIDRPLRRVYAQLRVRHAMSEETALKVWQHIRCVPFEAVRVQPHPRVTLAGSRSGQTVSSMTSDAPTHVVLYEALRGTTQSPSWVPYRDAFNSAFIEMLRGNYQRGLEAFRWIDDIPGLDPLLCSRGTHSDSGAGGSATENSRVRVGRRGRASAVTWRGVPPSPSDRTASGTLQLLRLRGICAANAQSGVSLPFVHDLTPGGSIRASEDLGPCAAHVRTAGEGVDPTRAVGAVSPATEAPTAGTAPGAVSPVRAAPSEEERRAREHRRQARDVRVVRFTSSGGEPEVDVSAALHGSGSRREATLFERLPRFLEDARGMCWDLVMSSGRGDLARSRRKRGHGGMLVAFSPSCGLASVEVRPLVLSPPLLPHTPSMSTSSNGHGSDGVVCSRGGSTHSGRVALAPPDAAATACPYLLRYFGHLDCRPRCGVLLLLSEYHAHDTLAEYMRCYGRPLPLRFIVPLCNGVLHGLEYLHSRGRAHGDLCPGNILVSCPGSSGDGAPRTAAVRLQGYLLDGVEDARTALSHFAPDAVPGEAAPEEQRGAVEAGTAEADVYSFGLVLLTLLRHSVCWERHVGDSERTGEPNKTSSPALTRRALAKMVRRGSDRFVQAVKKRWLVLGPGGGCGVTLAASDDSAALSAGGLVEPLLNSPSACADAPLVITTPHVTDVPVSGEAPAAVPEAPPGSGVDAEGGAQGEHLRVTDGCTRDMTERERAIAGGLAKLADRCMHAPPGSRLRVGELLDALSAFDC